VSRSFEAAWETLENNIRAQLNVIQACLDVPAPPRLLVVSSGEIYGAADATHLPSNEDTPLRPSSPYSVSKVTQDMLGLQYFLSHKLPILRVRPFNHLGPGQSEGFVAPDFAMQIARIEAGSQPPRVMVGNLTTQRDFTDVRDVTRAYRLIMERGTPGDVYNIASGKTYSMDDVLAILLNLTNVQVEVCQDDGRLRRGSIPILWGDASHLRAVTGWEPTIPLEQTLLDVLDDCRERVRKVN
jgi:GDP-4-dehydro-6-deoxy-D-mannose reductase